MSIEDQFDRLAQKMIQEAGKIECSEEEYAEGPHQMAEELLIAANAARDCAKRKSNEDSSL